MSSEIPDSSKADAALVCSYGYDLSYPYRPTVLGNLQVCAAGELLRSGQASNIVFAGGHIAKGYPAVSDVMANQLFLIFPDVSPRKVQAEKTAKGIESQLEVFRRMALSRCNKEKWEKLMVVADEAQMDRVRRNFPAYFPDRYQNVMFRTAEEILADFSDNPYYQELLVSWSAAMDKRYLRMQERKWSKVDQLPVVGRFILHQAGI